MSQITPEVSEGALSSVMGLTLAQLKKVLRPEGLQVSGAKSVLQTRIRERLSEYVRRNDTQRFFRLKAHVEHPDGTPPTSSSFGPAQSFGNSIPRPNNASPQAQPSSFNSGFHPARLVWKQSPFYDVLQPVTSIQECKVRETTRDSFECRIRLAQDIIDRFSRQAPGQDLRLMIYCAAEPVSTFVASDIVFPQSIEIKVNSNEVKANLRGLKNKPGSTRPADITDLIHKRPNYNNVLTVTYALTTKRFYLVVNLVNKISPESLVEEVKGRPRIPKDHVLHEMGAKAQDSEIQATSSIMSLKCPLSTLRMEVPCRSTHCTHNQCYDALSFLQLQEQAPTWTCPVCNKPATFSSIHVDGYVSEILAASSRAVEQVSIEPNGNWKPVSMDALQGQASGSDEGEDDEDLIEIQEPHKMGPIRSAISWTPSSLTRTPPASSREQSITSASVRSSSSKRPASAIIDLTFSSDDEEPSRPTKRQSVQQPGSQLLPSQPSQSAQPAQSSHPAPLERFPYVTPSFGQSQQQPPGAYQSGGVSFSLQRRDGYTSGPHLNPLGQ